jgi:alginate O-acetyltransferase complex protein AlgI
LISFEYFSILLISLILYWVVPKQSIRNILLVVTSLIFIYLLDKWSVIVVLGLTLFSYLFGNIIYKYPKKGWIHFLGVCGVLLVLIIFKYLGFLTGIYNSLADFIKFLPKFEILKLLLPLGISYIVFKHISYLTDIKWGLVKPGRFINFLLYSSLFTIFVAGPIERFERFKPQVEVNKIEFTWQNIDYGFTRIVLGMFKKLVLADWIGYFINPVWDKPYLYSSWIGLLALVGYAFQIYFDFAGYSDIAIGASRLFGFKIMENFNKPYLASNISQFWRRWHISLSDWIRDYLFFPLSHIGSKKFWQIFCVPIIAMALCGLWHGPAWHFVFWGVWHGVGLSIYQLWSEKKRIHKNLNRATKAPWFKYSGILINFSFVTLGWLWFK